MQIPQTQKLYVLIRADLSVAQQAVQAGHAVAKFGVDYPHLFRDWQTNGNVLVYLNVPDQDALYHWKQTLDDGGIKNSAFSETDGSVFTNLYSTAGLVTVAVAPNWMCQYVLFTDLPLALKPASKSKRRWYQR